MWPRQVEKGYSLQDLIGCVSEFEFFLNVMGRHWVVLAEE